MVFRILILIATLLFLTTCDEYKKSATSSVISQEKLESIRKNRAFAKAYSKHFKEVFKKKGSAGAAVSIVMDDRIVLAKGFGYRNAKKYQEVDANTGFRIGSLSKGFAGVLAAKLMDEGKLNWEEKIKPHVPEFILKDIPQTYRVKLKHCLSHTIGLPRHTYTDLVERNRPLSKIFSSFGKVKHLKTEGSRFAYQNAPFALVEPVVEKVTGKPYSENLKINIFYPLKMENTSTSKNGLTAKNNYSLPHEFSHKRKKWYPRKITDKYYNVVSAGGINSNAKDMAKYLDMLLGNKPEIVSAAALDSVFVPRIEMKYEKRYYTRWKETDDSYYGLGWKIHEFKDRKIMHHGGFVNGFRSEIAIDRENKVGVCFMFNASTKLANTIIRDFYNFYDDYFEKKERTTVP